MKFKAQASVTSFSVAQERPSCPQGSGGSLLTQQIRHPGKRKEEREERRVEGQRKSGRDGWAVSREYRSVLLGDELLPGTSKPAYPTGHKTQQRKFRKRERSLKVQLLSYSEDLYYKQEDESGGRGGGGGGGGRPGLLQRSLLWTRGGSANGSPILSAGCHH